MSEELTNIDSQQIQKHIFTLRGVQVMIDRNLAELYQVETRALKQAVRRNQNRFPDDFMFVLTDSEVDSLVSQSVIPSKKQLGGAKPFAFTEQGVATLSSVLTSDRPIDIKTFRNAHDRFLILDDKTIYHFGASLKDLGKKWFAFSRFDKGAVELLRRVGE